MIRQMVFVGECLFTAFWEKITDFWGRMERPKLPDPPSSTTSGADAQSEKAAEDVCLGTQFC